MATKQTPPFSKTASFWDKFVATQGPEAIAKQLLKDAELADEGEMPSSLALHIPNWNKSPRAASKIAAYLTPTPDLHDDIREYLYDTLRTRLQTNLAEGEASLEAPLPEDGYFLPADLEAKEIAAPKRPKDMAPPEANEPTAEEVEIALRVLRFTSHDARKSSAFNLQKAVHAIEKRFNVTSAHKEDLDLEVQFQAAGRLASSESTSALIEPVADGSWKESVNKYHASRPPTRLRVCYICHYLLIDPHHFYRSMCRHCGAFNHAGSALSLPSSMKLAGRQWTALVTGARIHLGYRTALRLLRCGAFVIATSRYPNDAAVRYSQEPDFAEWRERLKIVGADFRTARDAFALARVAVPSALAAWGTNRLHLLVNNAAQTWTDSIQKEERAIQVEQQQSSAAAATNLIITKAPEGVPPYQPRVRAGVAPLALYGGVEVKKTPLVLPAIKPATEDDSQEPDNPLAQQTQVTTTATTTATSLTDSTTQQQPSSQELDPYVKTSWLQTISEIPYEDVVTAYGVNAFVPLVLCRELLPLMGSTTAKEDDEAELSKNPDKKAQKLKMRLGRAPRGYIVNVSAREGIFENDPSHHVKRGKHLHTNMAKAALNMITQTEAATAWHTRAVAMNTVDPGYLSAPTEILDMWGEETIPLSWEDGAGRVLWSVAIGEVEGRAVWGRFLKDYGTVNVDLGLDRS
ncbi:hypothetical protein B0H63DRAFT_488552 [Podospora didyma]|uniref:Oxidoreductase n=1 Tax=Podospora didyma TaxID=330526 RepID=A0AAE0K1S0_9PEZI|nr:hypothetical protein B0H63DRAFT_488552 [Podospora didyma]